MWAFLRQYCNIQSLVRKGLPVIRGTTLCRSEIESAHNVQIQAEVGRLALGRWFFDAFIKHCLNAGVAIDDSA